MRVSTANDSLSAGIYAVRFSFPAKKYGHSHSTHPLRAPLKLTIKALKARLTAQAKMQVVSPGAT
jgi:hypothetical protein